jgi:basic membrane protein A
MLLTACASDDDGTDDTTTGTDGGEGASGEDVQVGMAFDVGGRGDRSFNDSAAAGLDRAGEELGISFQDLSPAPDGSNRDELLRELADGGHNPILGIGYAFFEVMDTVADEYPDVQFIRIDGPPSDRENVAVMTFAEEQGSFLMGVAAALKTESDHIGFVGGVETPLIQKFEAGYIAGAEAVNPDIQVDVTYLTQAPDFSGFADPAKGKTAPEPRSRRRATVAVKGPGRVGSQRLIRPRTCPDPKRAQTRRAAAWSCTEPVRESV